MRKPLYYLIITTLVIIPVDMMMRIASILVTIFVTPRLLSLIIFKILVCASNIILLEHQTQSPSTAGDEASAVDFISEDISYIQH
jgi:hypothetical protein